MHDNEENNNLGKFIKLIELQHGYWALKYENETKTLQAFNPESILRSSVLKSSFFQALGKSCGWKGQTIMHWPFGTEFSDKNVWEFHALMFHKINLIKGWNKAVEYLSEVTK